VLRTVTEITTARQNRRQRIKKISTDYVVQIKRRTGAARERAKTTAPVCSRGCCVLCLGREDLREPAAMLLLTFGRCTAVFVPRAANFNC
jgi:hypothetical protein